MYDADMVLDGVALADDFDFIAIEEERLAGSAAGRESAVAEKFHGKLRWRRRWRQQRAGVQVRWLDRFCGFSRHLDGHRYENVAPRRFVFRGLRSPQSIEDHAVILRVDRLILV